MVGAILRGEKTETRRLLLPQPELDNMEIEHIFSNPWKGRFMVLFETPRPHMRREPNPDALMCHAQCQQGFPGDKLWVRERWATNASLDRHKPSCMFDVNIDYYSDIDNPKVAKLKDRGRWRSLIHMCRWMSRLTLQIEEIKAERLQEITAVDACKEGFGWIDGRRDGNSIIEFREYWDKINKGFMWKSNPWVWVIKFKVIERIK